MSKKKGADEAQDDENEIVTPTPKEGVVDLTQRVKVECTDKAPHHKEGDVTEVSKTLADKMVANGWGKIVAMIAFVLLANFAAFSQIVAPAAMKTSAGVDSVNVAGTGTGFIYIRTGIQGTSTAIQFVAHKVSGTIAGTVTLMGSVDGIHFKPALVAEASTAIPTFTATDVATQSYVWRLTGSPYAYYGISWTGTGTMSGYMRGKIYTH